MIPRRQYEEIVSVLPILCVDLVITNESGEYLLVKRENEPLKDCWWVVGGRVLKGETILAAGYRKAKQELGTDIAITGPLGFFEAPDQQDPFGRGHNRYHAVSIVLAGTIHSDQQIVLDSQSSSWKFARLLPDTFIINPFCSASADEGRNKQGVTP